MSSSELFGRSCTVQFSISSMEMWMNLDSTPLLKNCRIHGWRSAFLTGSSFCACSTVAQCIFSNEKILTEGCWPFFVASQTSPKLPQTETRLYFNQDDSVIPMFSRSNHHDNHDENDQH